MTCCSRAANRAASSSANLKFQLAVRLFEVGQLSLGKAAELAGWNRLSFADELGRLKIPVVNLDNLEIQTELSAIRGDHHRR
jgi:predicted HTH domain antitoxin